MKRSVAPPAAPAADWLRKDNDQNGWVGQAAAAADDASDLYPLTIRNPGWLFWKSERRDSKRPLLMYAGLT
jgi:hypothetical protein